MISKNAYGYCVVVLVGILVFLGVQQMKPVKPVEAERRLNAGSSDFASAEAKAWDFVRRKLTAANGVVGYRIDRKKMSPDAVLESMGQVMEYLALAGNYESVDRYAQLADRYFRVAEGYYAWKISLEGGAKNKATASLDDIRFFEACYLAAVRSGKDRSSELKTLAGAIYRFDVNQVDGSSWMVSWYDGNDDTRATDIELFYLDTATLSHLASVDPRWRQPRDNAKNVLLRIPDVPFGLYPARYDIGKGKYISGDSVDMIENLYTAIFLHEAGGNTTAFADFLKREIAERKAIRNDYTRDGKAVNSDECVAVYALAARFLAMSGDGEGADWCYSKFLSMQIGAGDAFAGGFSADGQTFYAFDQFEALLALRAGESGAWGPGAGSGAGADGFSAPGLSRPK